MDYAAGPGGTSVPIDADYVVRPVYNLSGMGVGAQRVYLTRGDQHTVAPGYFWCECFAGTNVTVDYEWDNNHTLQPVFAAQGYRTSPDLYRFSAWQQVTPPDFVLPAWVSLLHDVPRINIEFVCGNIIEIHLRAGCDFPAGATKIIPVWSDMTSEELLPFLKHGYELNTNADDADGHLSISRTGFLYK